MGLVFSLHLGFWPVWFFDCTTCVAGGPRLPAGWGPLGGMSLFAVAGTSSAVWLWVGTKEGMSGRAHRAWAAVAGASLLTLAWLAFVGRFPGTLPTVLVGVIPPLVAGVLFAVGAGPPSGPRVQQVPPPAVPRLSRLARAIGILSVAALGGVLSLAAIVLGALAWERSVDPREQRWAAFGIGLGIASGVLRWVLVHRYEAFGLLF